MVEQLKGLTDVLGEGSPSEERLEALQKAFSLFMKESERLENSYRRLVESKDKALQAKVSELDATTRYLDSILANMSQGMVFVDIRGRVTTYNHAAEKILDKSAEAVLGGDFQTIFGLDFFGFNMAEALEKSCAPETSYVELEKGNALEVSPTFVFDDESAVKGVIVLFRDITQLRRLQTIASRNDRMKELGEMAASVAHEIRNPLGGIKGFASLLYRDLEGKEELQGMAKQIVEGSITLDGLVTDVLNYSRPVQLQLKLSNIALFLEELVTFVKADEGLGKEVEISLKGKELLIPIDAHAMRRVFLNLFANAAQAMSNRGEIVVSWQQVRGNLSLSVSDCGCGIEPEKIENIFSPFFTTKVKGNGFGLSEVYKIIQSHGGSIEVNSVVGEGTTFTILLPMKS